MNIKILAVGKIKENYLIEAVLEYKKRLGSYCNIEIVETKDEKTKENMSSAEKEIILKAEAKRLMSKISERDYVITLEIDGRQMSSEMFAETISDFQNRGVNSIVFVIGGSCGLHKSVSSRSDMRLSFSKMTFPHQLMRVVLLEQIYRSYRIINNHPYHK